MKVATSKTHGMKMNERKQRDLSTVDWKVNMNKYIHWQDSESKSTRWCTLFKQWCN